MSLHVMQPSTNTAVFVVSHAHAHYTYDTWLTGLRETEVLS